MIRINDNGDLVDDIPNDETLLATAAELKAAFAEKGMVLISVEDANTILMALHYPENVKALQVAAAVRRLQVAIKEAP